MWEHIFSGKKTKDDAKANSTFSVFYLKFSNTEDLAVCQLFLNSSQVRLTELNHKCRFYRVNQSEELTAKPVMSI